MSEKATTTIDFADFLASDVLLEEVPDLHTLTQAKPVIDAFIAIFRGSEAEVLLRLLVLRELGRADDQPRFSPEALRSRFSYIDPIKLETVLKRLRDFLLIHFGDDGLYQLDNLGRNCVSALQMLLRFGEDEDADLGFLTAQLAGLDAVDAVTLEALSHLLGKLNDLSWHFEEAIASGSEFRIEQSRRRLSANLKWIERGTELIRKLLQRADENFDIARLAQRIALAQSRLTRVDAAFQRAINKIESQRVTLGSSGVSSSDIAQWLRQQTADNLSALMHDALSFTPSVSLLAGGHELIDRAEEAFGRLRHNITDIGLPAACAAPTGEIEQEDLGRLARFNRRLQAVNQNMPLADLVISDDSFAEASYRLSLLALLGQDAEANDDGPIGVLMKMPLLLSIDNTLQNVDHPEIQSISTGQLQPTQPAHNPKRMKTNG